MPVSVLLVAMIFTGSKGLQWMTVSMFTVFKNITIVCIALGERRLFGSNITSLMWLSFALIVFRPSFTYELSRSPVLSLGQ